MTTQVLVGIGSNLHDRISYIQKAVASIDKKCGEVIAVSSCYESEPVGGKADRRFVNATLLCQTNCSPHEFLVRLFSIEKDLGRVRLQKWGNRSIDLDILLWQKKDCETKIVNLPHLQIPHPRMLLRDFVLVPACEIAPFWKHPITSSNLLTESQKLTTKSIVHRLTKQYID